MKNKILLFVIAFLPLFSTAQDTLQQPLSFVQEMPTYIGGEDAMMQLIFDNVIYPEYEKSMNIQGSVYVKFIVEKDGTPTHFEVTKGVGDGPGLDSAALYACKQLGKFNPGTQNGVPQRVYLTIPIKFSLADDYEDPAQERLSRSDLKQIKKDGKYICDMMFQMIEAQRAGDQVKIEKLTAEFEKEAAILEKRYPKDSAREDRLEDTVQPCLEEAMKAAMGK